MDVVMLDCDGVLANSTPELIKVSIESIGKFFPVEKLDKKAEELVASFGGRSFASGFERALESLFPEEENKEKREKCCQIVAAKRTGIYDKVRPFPGALETVQKIIKNYHLVLSSGLERTIIEKWLKKNGFIRGLFDEIYSLEDGEKNIHVQLVREKFSDALMVVYVGDSFSDMKLGNFPIGVARNRRIQRQLLREGAQEVVSSLEEVLNVL